MTVLIAIFVAAIVTGGLAAIAALLLRMGGEAEMVALKEAATAMRTTSFAYTVRRIRSVVTIENMNGDATVVRQHEGIKPNDGFTVHKLNGAITGTGTAKEPPALEKIDDVPGNHSFQAKTTNDGHRAVFEIEFTPALEATNEVSFTVAMEFNALHLMTRAAVAKEYAKESFRNEYHGFRANIPTGEIELEVVFPPGFEAKFGAVVFYGDTEVISREETRRIRNLLERRNGSARLRIENPQLTFLYAIYWIPRR